MKESTYLQLINSGPVSLFSSYLYPLTSCVLRVVTSDLQRIPDSYISGEYSPLAGIFSIPEEESNLPKEKATGESSSLNVKK